MKRAALLLVLLLLVGGATAYWMVSDRPEGNPPTVSVEVPAGASAQQLIDLLQRHGLAPHPSALHWTLKLKGTYARLQAGSYTLPGDANALELAELLKKPASPVPSKILTLIPGESVWEAAKRFEALGLNARYILDRAETLEGYLYPETYHLARDDDIAAAVQRAKREFDKVWSQLQGGRSSHLGRADIVTLASLIAEEAQLVSEGPRIAGVFYNRLAKKIPLATDPTLMYHPERVGKVPTRADRKRPGPYNTYLNPGLPPGPICSPGRPALEAALNPEAHDWLYFVAKRDGTGAHAFAATLDEHRANIDRYLKR